MASDQGTRRRRPHKRSRLGCSACKQRHIRCGEQKPVCTNCLVRGGQCIYPEAAAHPGPTSGSPTTPLSDELAHWRPQDPVATAIRTSPLDPFDMLPIKMPHSSLDLLNHFTQYRILTRTAVRKNPNSICVAIAIQDAGILRAALLLSAMHYYWQRGSLGELEETYLYHKVEAMRIVNDQLSAPAAELDDGCLSLIAALALSDGGMGQTDAAEAHLNGLRSLLDMRQPATWQGKLYGLLQRVVLVASSFIAAGKSYQNETEFRRSTADVEHESPTVQEPHFIRPPGALFSATPCLATNLSPFYLATPPDVETCKSDAETEVMFHALRRLSTISASSSAQPRPGPREVPISAIGDELTALLFEDTESYVASLLFKPATLPREPEYVDSSANRSLTASLTTGHDLVTEPYGRLMPSLFASPTSSRAAATASYLYLHVMLSHPRPRAPADRYRPSRLIDPALLYLLIETLRADATTTEMAMRQGAYSAEIWLWKVVVAGHALAAAAQEEPREEHLVGWQNEESSSSEDEGEAGLETAGAFDSEEDTAATTSSDEDEDIYPRRANEMGGSRTRRQGPPRFARGRMRTSDVAVTRRAAWLHESQAWFGERLTIWSRAARVNRWAEARKALFKIAWMEQWDGEAAAEQRWLDAVRSSTVSNWRTSAMEE